MSPVDFKKWPCRPVEFKGQGPSLGVRSVTNRPSVAPADRRGQRY